MSFQIAVIPQLGTGASSEESLRCVPSWPGCHRVRNQDRADLSVGTGVGVGSCPGMQNCLHRDPRLAMNFTHYHLQAIQITLRYLFCTIYTFGIFADVPYPERFTVSRELHEVIHPL